MTQSQPHLQGPRALDPASWLTPSRFALGFGLLVFVAFVGVVLGTVSFVFRDFGHFGYPLALYHREAFWRGEIPLWNPLSQCGLPFLAQWNTLVLYPGSLIYLLLPLPWSLNLFNLLHLFWAGLGMYHLARRWTRSSFAAGVAGLAYAFGGLLQHSLMWPNNLAALGWMPWVVLTVPQGWQGGGRPLVRAIIVGSMQMLAGAPEVILLTWGIVGARLTVDLIQQRGNRLRMGRRGLLAVLAVASLSAAQLLPFLELLVDSQRDTHFYESLWPMPITGWANLLVPLFHCHPTVQGTFFQWSQGWTPSYYAGLTTLALALLAVLASKDLRTRAVALIAMLGLVLALGEAGGVYAALKYALPQLGFIRFPIKFVVWTVFALPLLAASGMAVLLSAGASARSRIRHLLLVAGGLAVILTVLVLLAWRYPAEDESWGMMARNAFTRAGFLGMTVGLLGFFVRNVAGQRRWLAGVAVLLAVAVDGLSHMPNLAPTVRSSVFDPLGNLARPAPRPGESRAMVSYWAHERFNRNFQPGFEEDFRTKRIGWFANCNLLDGVPKVDGLYSLSLRDADAIHSLLYLRTNDTRLARVFQPTNRISFEGLIDFLAVEWFSAPQRPSEFVVRTNHLPWVTAGQQPAFLSSADTLSRLVTPGFDPRREVLLPPESRVLCATARPGAARILSSQFSAHRIRVELRAEAPGLVVLSQSHFRPWRARVDGAAAEIHRANLAFQAVLVPAGSRVLELTYEDRRFRVGLLVSVAAWITLIGWRSAARREV
jgi:hypothetical protein